MRGKVCTDLRMLSPVSRLQTCNVNDLKDAYDLHVWSNLSILQRALSYLRNSGGMVLAVGSRASEYGYCGLGSYCLGKSGLKMMMEVLFVEEQEKGSDVFFATISPGIIDTEMQSEMREHALGKEMRPGDAEFFLKLHRDKKLVSPDCAAQNYMDFIRKRPEELNGKFIYLEDPTMRAIFSKDE